MAAQGGFPTASVLSFSAISLGSVKRGKKHARRPSRDVGDDSTVIELKVQCRLDELGRYFEQLFGEGNELFDRKTAVPFVHRLGERVGCGRSASGVAAEIYV
jgi:hypothetical protein